jgi:DNA (cytosine-5)-methyltransferase 1
VQDAAQAHLLPIAFGAQVRRLTPTECERLQGFSDGYTQIPWHNKAAEDCPDGPRYKAMGNSMAVPVMRWIGEKIQEVENKGSMK